MGMSVPGRSAGSRFSIGGAPLSLIRSHVGIRLGWEQMSPSSVVVLRMPRGRGQRTSCC